MTAQWRSRWRDTVDWWTDPRLAYAAGLEDGVAIGRAERDAIDDRVHRETAARLARTIDRVDRRRAADRGELTP